MKTNFLLLVVLAAALLVRIIGLVPGHPPSHPDEPMSTGSALEMVTHDDLNPRRFDYPAGVPLLHYGIYRSLIIPIILLKNIVVHPTWILSAAIGGGSFFTEHSIELFGKNGIDALYWSRFITALLATASVYLTYLIGRKLFHPVAGLTAAFFVAFNYRHVLSSHLALSDIPNNFFVLLALYCSWLLWEKNTRARYLVCALVVALSISMKYQFFALIPFLFAHFAVTLKKGNTTKLFNKDFLVALVLVPLIFVIINPYLFINIKTAFPVIQYVSLRYGLMVQRFNFYPLFYLYYWGVGQLPMVAIFFGFILSLFLFPFRTVFLLTYIGPFLYMFLYYSGGGVYVRNFSTVIPVLLIFAGFIVWKFYEKLQKFVPRTVSSIASLVLILVFNIVPMKDSILLSWAYTKPWARDQLTEWAEERLASGSVMINDNLGLPTSMENKITIIPWSREEGNAITEFMDRDIDFAVLNVAWNYIYFFWNGLPMHEMIRYSGTPVPLLKESYHGLLLTEYLRYAVHETYKPWQAPDDAYLVLKIPKRSVSPGKVIGAFDFAKDANGWHGAIWTKETGNAQNGSLILNKMANTGGEFVRLISPFIPVISDNVYTIEAYLTTNEALKSNERDGFLRVDFYGSDQLSELERGGIAQAVSGRVFGPPAWIKKRIVTSAPEGAKFMTMSVQSSSDASRTYWVDDVQIYEAEQPLTERFPDLRYIQPTMSSDELFPHGIY